MCHSAVTDSTWCHWHALLWYWSRTGCLSHLSVTGKLGHHSHAVPVYHFFIPASSFWGALIFVSLIIPDTLVFPLDFHEMKRGENTLGNLKCSRFFVLYHWPLTFWLSVWFGVVCFFYFQKQANLAFFDSSIFWLPDHFPTSRTRLHFLSSLQYQKKIEYESIFKLWTDDWICVWF